MSRCLYCNGTGRTKENPNFCDHCKTPFIKKEISEEISKQELMANFGYIRDVQIAESWEEKFIKKYLAGLGRNLTNKDLTKISYLQNKLNDIQTNSLFNDQIIVFMSSYIYEILIYWAYKAMIISNEENYKLIGSIYNLNLIGDLQNSKSLLTEQIVFIEYNNYNTKNLDKLFDILSIRKRNGLPTFVLTNQPYKLFYDGGKYSVDECKDSNQIKGLTLATYMV